MAEHKNEKTMKEEKNEKNGKNFVFSTNIKHKKEQR
jgi:hypothetical protein